MIVVAALGGNALASPGQPLDTDVQRENLRRAAHALAGIARHHALVVTHGNGPQVGQLALQAEALGAPRTPLDVLGAESEGMLGYLIEQELGNALPGRQVATLLTQVVVDLDDPAFRAPTKPIGPVYDEAEARRHAQRDGWTIAPDRGGFRRVVPSPEPRSIRELETIRILLDARHVVVCAGGGGIPVAVAPSGALRGVEAVIDKDLCAARLAADLGAGALLLLTDVAAVFEDWPEPRRVAIRTASPADLAHMDLDAGSMGPKVRAACRFARRPRVTAAIGALDDAQRLLSGEAGTRIGAGLPYEVVTQQATPQGAE